MHSNVTSEWVDGNLVFYDKSRTEIARFDGTNTAFAPSSIKDPTETVTATNVLTAAESGKVCFLSAATEFVTTLPAAAAGLKFTFIVAAAPSGASYTVVTPGGADLIHGLVVSSEDALGSGDATSGTAADTITFVDGKAQIGDRVEVVSDGTKWYAMAYATQQDAITYTAS